MEEKETIQPIEITWEEVQTWEPESFVLVDTRGDEAVDYGMIPGAIAIPECELVDKLAAAAGDKKVILYCSRGQNSKVSAEYFREQGMDVYSLQGGYTGWLLNLMQKEQPEHTGQFLESDDPIRSFRSKIVTLAPFWAAVIAAIIPAAPLGMKLYCHLIGSEILQALGKYNFLLIDFNAMLLLAGSCDLLG